MVLPDVGRVHLRLVDAGTGARVEIAESGLWGLAWRESGTEVFQELRDPKTLPAGLELEFPIAVSTAGSNSWATSR